MAVARRNIYFKLLAVGYWLSANQVISSYMNADESDSCQPLIASCHSSLLVNA